MMRSLCPRPRFSLGLLLGLVVVVGLSLGVRQALYVPMAERAALRLRLERAGLKVQNEAAEPSWRDSLFRRDDLLEVVAVEAVGGELPPDVLPAFWRFPRLRSVKLRGCDVTDADMAHLAKVEGLTTLDLANTRVGDAGLTTLSSLPLEDLDLVGTRVTGDSVATLARMTTLGRLILPRSIDVATLAKLGPLTGLSVLAREHAASFEGAGLELDSLPSQLSRLPLVYVGPVDNPFQPGRPESRSAPHGTPALPAAPVPLPAGGRAGLRLVSVGLDPRATDDRAWRLLAGQDRIDQLTIAAAYREEPSSHTVDRLGPLPPIRSLYLEVDRLDAAELRALRNRPGLAELTIDVDRLDLTPDAFLDALTDGPALAKLTLQGPWPFELLPGVERLADRAPIADLLLAGPTGNWTLRSGGKPVFKVPASNANLIPWTWTGAPPPPWLVEASKAGGRWIAIPPKSGTTQVRPFGPDDDDALGAWLGCGRVISLTCPLADPPDERVWQALREAPNLTTVMTWGKLSDEQVLELLARPTLRSLTVASPRLTPALVERVRTIPHAESVTLASPQFDRGLVAKYPQAATGGPIPTPDAPPTGTQRLELLAIGLAGIYITPAPPPPPDPRDADLELYEPPLGAWGDWVAELAARYPEARTLWLESQGDAPPPPVWTDRFPRLEHVQITRVYGPPGPTDPWLTAIPGRAAWKTLRLNWMLPGREPTALPWVDGMPALEELCLEFGTVSVGALARLADRPRLRRLVLRSLGGDDSAAPHDTTFLRNGAAWRWLIVPDLRVTADDLAHLAALDSVELLAVDGLLVDAAALPAIERLLSRGAAVRLRRANLDFAAVERLRTMASARGGSFDVVTTVQDGPLASVLYPWPPPR